MTVSAPAARSATRDAPVVVVLLLGAAGAWAMALVLSHRMGVMPGTMGLGVVAFVAVWLLMMSAMMLPAVSPVARLYARTMQAGRPWRLVQFVSGYLLVWALAGLPAFALSAAAGRVAAHHPQGARWAAVATFAVVAAYQVTPLKAACLRACRSPMGLLLRYAGFRGRGRDLRAGAHHGLYCLGCCWALFAALIVVGVMNVGAMVALAVVVAAEKLWVHGEGVSRVVAVVAAALAVLAAVHPSFAAGLYATPGPMSM